MDDTPLEPPRRLDDPPAVVWGCTRGEITTLCSIGVLVALPVGAILLPTLYIGRYWVGLLALPLCMGLILGVMYQGAAVLRRLKRGRPALYYWHRLRLFWIRLGLKRPVYITYTGPWGLGRY